MLIANLQEEDLKIFKSDTFENYKSFVPVEVQNRSNQISEILLLH